MCSNLEKKYCYCTKADIQGLKGNTQKFNNFPAIHDNCCLLYPLLVYFGELYCKQYGPRSDSFKVFASMIKLVPGFHSLLNP